MGKGRRFPHAPVLQRWDKDERMERFTRIYSSGARFRYTPVSPAFLKIANIGVKLSTDLSTGLSTGYPQGCGRQKLSTGLSTGCGQLRLFHRAVDNFIHRLWTTQKGRLSTGPVWITSLAELCSDVVDILPCGTGKVGHFHVHHVPRNLNGCR